MEQVRNITLQEVNSTHSYINSLIKEVNTGHKDPKIGFIEMSRMAGKLNAALYLCVHSHTPRGYLDAIYETLYTYSRPINNHTVESLLKLVRETLNFIRERTLTSKKMLTFRGVESCQEIARLTETQILKLREMA